MVGLLRTLIADDRMKSRSLCVCFLLCLHRSRGVSWTEFIRPQTGWVDRPLAYDEITKRILQVRGLELLVIGTPTDALFDLCLWQKQEQHRGGEGLSDRTQIGSSSVGLQHFLDLVGKDLELVRSGAINGDSSHVVPSDSHESGAFARLISLSADKKQ